MCYTYDELSRVTSKTVKNLADNTVISTESFTYDAAGNITNAPESCFQYDTNNRLISFNGNAVSYDLDGNMLSNGSLSCTYDSANRLVSAGGHTYTYNANGIRTSKKVNGVLHTYTLDGTKILREVWDGNTLVPLYDNEDSVCGILYNNVPYYFIKNLQGDVIAIVDKDAQTVARYSYDAWGAITSAVTYTELTKGVDIANINPFRYRGYYYDEEIGLYYLQSRYYDACVGRFVNADDTRFICYIVNTTHNAYSFAKNDPITDSEYLGYISLSAVLMITCALVGAIAKLEDAFKLINKSWFKKKYSVSTGLLVSLVAFIWGGVEGLLKSSKITGKWWIVCGTIGAIVAVAEYIAVSGRNARNYSPNDLLWIALKGFVNSIDIPQKGILKDIVKRILTEIGKNHCFG